MIRVPPTVKDLLNDGTPEKTVSWCTVLVKMTTPGSGANLLSCVIILTATKVVNLYELLARAYETVFYVSSRALGNDYWDKYNNKNVYPG